MAANGTANGESSGRKKQRSPNYPLFDLEKAVERTKTLYDVDRQTKLPIGVVHDRWGYKSGSAAGNQAVAAVKAYGLVTVEGSGDKRQIAVSDTGRRIVLSAPDRADLLQTAALEPALFRTIWEHFQDTGLPQDDVLKHHLIFDRNVNEDVVDRVIERLRGTLAFSGLSNGDSIQPEDEPDDSASGASQGNENAVAVGQYVQWTSQGVDRFQEGARRVLGLSDDGQFAFVLGTKTGIPVSEIAVKDPPAESPLDPPLNPFSEPDTGGNQRQAKPGSKEDVYTLGAGDAVLQWPERITEDEYEEITDWLELMKRKLKRSVASPEASDVPEFLK